MSAFAMFSRKAPSLLAFDKERAAGHLHTLDGLQRVPCDTRLREILDPVSPKGRRPVCTRVFRPLQRGKALEAMAFLEGHALLALDGTAYCSSKTLHCASGLDNVHRHGSLTQVHQRWGAALIHPDRRAVIPLRPEPLVRHEGTEKNAGERHAAKRFRAKLRQEHPHLQCLVPDDSLSAKAPALEPRHAHGLPSIRGVNAGDHAQRFPQLHAAEHAGRVTCEERHDRAAGVVHRVRLVNARPLNAAHTDGRVHGIEDWEVGDDKVQHGSGVTDIRVSQRQVYQLRRGGRARWNIANETFNTLKNQGYHVEPNDGHGEPHLAVVLARLRRRAFVVDQAPQRCGALVQAVWATLGSTRLLWERMRALFYDYALASLGQLVEALWYGVPKSSPLVTLDAS